MKIRDNTFRFIISLDSSTKKYFLMNGEFYIKDHKISSGQLCDHKNGDTLHCTYTGEFNFRVGRKKSKDVGKWFNEKCDPNKNTFGHRAKELNFAFIGTLCLEILDRYGSYRVSFDDILIAQGSTCTSNNWWFGGKNCYNFTRHIVASTGSSENNNNFRFTFLRGQNPNCTVNTVEITDIEKLQRKRRRITC